MLNPGRKISETFLDFAAPLLYDLPSEEPEHKARQILSICFTAWNAVIFADVLNDNKYLEQIGRLTADKPETARLIQQMIVRKRTHFAHDERLIGTWDVTRTDDGINLRADARDPSPAAAEHFASGRRLRTATVEIAVGRDRPRRLPVSKGDSVLEGLKEGHLP